MKGGLLKKTIGLVVTLITLTMFVHSFNIFGIISEKWLGPDKSSNLHESYEEMEEAFLEEANKKEKEDEKTNDLKEKGIIRRK